MIQTLHHNGTNPRNDDNAKARTVLYALLAGAEGCGPAARNARLAEDDELADFLCRVQVDAVYAEGERDDPGHPKRSKFYASTRRA